ncbi:hypothetical protein LU699_13130 [Luteimonas fraxinea]|uniref:Uncharacterized protein n=1 Tax=Luteimonas fraxinea TaxID=2901869 RepID=A0ABS8UHB1_9GAMM|nr:hypothetical protein [Luteimonas fraxinea]MCD9098043.1 hypothetical protein [Luteimonas fraxinea]UHH09232.1 hypothetical protein LU699_13130 [Luteimonas fraxinea]
MAVTSYVDYVESVFGTDRAIDGLGELRRGLALSRAYGKRDEALQARYWSVLLAEVPHAIENNWPGLIFRLCDEALERSRDACEAIAPQIEAKARALDESSPQQAAEWHGMAHRMRWRLGQRAEATRSLLAQSAAMVRAAEHSAIHQPLLAPMQLLEGIRLARRAKADPQRVQELRERLSQYERATLDHYQTHSHEIDVNDWVEWIHKRIQAPSFFDSLLRMAFGIGAIADLDEVKARVVKSASEFPLSHLFGSTHATADGTIVARRPPLDPSDADSLRDQMVRSAVETDFDLRARHGCPIHSSSSFFLSALFRQHQGDRGCVIRGS